MSAQSPEATFGEEAWGWKEAHGHPRVPALEPMQPQGLLLGDREQGRVA